MNIKTATASHFSSIVRYLKLLLIFGFAINSPAIAANLADELKSIKSGVEADLPSMLGYMPEYKIWNTYSNYVGAYRNNGMYVATFKISSKANIQFPQDLSLLKSLSSEYVVLQAADEDSVTWGELWIIFYTLVRASKLGLLPPIEGSSISPDTGRLNVNLRHEEDEAQIRGALEYLGVSLKNVNFTCYEMTLLNSK